MKPHKTERRPASRLERRKDARVPTPSGMWVSWRFEKQSYTSRVLDFSASGVFILSHEIVAVGSAVKLIFALPEGELKLNAVVRNFIVGRGMGVEFVSTGGKELRLVLKALKRLRLCDPQKITASTVPGMPNERRYS